MSNTQVNFEVGKKYHYNGDVYKTYNKIIARHIVDGKIYYSVEQRQKCDNALYQVAVYYENALSGMVPYVRTREVSHERWVIWFKMIDNTLTCTVEKTETTKESWESKYPRWEFLKCEKITYIETIEE